MINDIGSLYFIKADEIAIKVGWTAGSVYTRMKTLGTCTPHSLSLIGAYLAQRKDETLVHRKFGEHRIKGEWYHIVPQILRFAEEKCKHFKADLYFSEVLGPIDEFKDKINGRQERLNYARAKTGISSYDFHRWSSQGRMLSPTQVAKIRKMLADWPVGGQPADFYDFREVS